MHGRPVLIAVRKRVRDAGRWVRQASWEAPQAELSYGGYARVPVGAVQRDLAARRGHVTALGGAVASAAAAPGPAPEAAASSVIGKNGGMRQRWARLPPWARWVLAGYLTGFADGTGAHVRWMMHGGIHAYAAFGYVPVQVFMVALIVLDPLAFALIALVRREGVWTCPRTGPGTGQPCPAS